MSAFIDEAWIFRPPLVDSSTSKWFQQFPKPHSQGIVHFDPASPKFDPKLIYKNVKLDRSDLGLLPRDDTYYYTTGHVDRSLKKALVKKHDVFDVEAWLQAEMKLLLDEEIASSMESVLYGDGSPPTRPIADQVQKLNDQLYDELGMPRSLQYHPTIKENNMSERQLRTPESPIDTKDLAVAGRALGLNQLDDLLDAVALVQALDANQRLVRAQSLKSQDVGNHVQIVDGLGGVLTDLRGHDEFDRNSGGQVKAVLDGKMVDISRYELVVLTALAN